MRSTVRVRTSLSILLAVVVALAVTLSRDLPVPAGIDVGASGVLTSQMVLKVTATGSSTTYGLSTVTDPVLKDYTQNLSSGTGANQASNFFHDQRTLTASATENLTLTGSLTNGFGATLTFTTIKAIIIHASSANTNNVIVGGAAANGWISWANATDSAVVVRPGGTFILVAPDATAYTVTPATANILKVANSGAGTSVVYDVIIVGAD